MPYNGGEVSAVRRPSCYASSPSKYSSYGASTMNLGSSSTSSAYLTSRTSLSHTRSSSLDRSISHDLSTTYRPSSHHLTSTSFRSVTSSTSRPPRSPASYLTGSTSLDTSTLARRLDTDLKARLARFDFTTGIRSSSLRSSVMSSPRTSYDAIHDHVSSPVLTNYRRLGDAGSLLSSRHALDRDLERRLELKIGDSSSCSNLLDSDSGISTASSASSSSSSSSGSSSPSLSTGSSRSHSKLNLDENSNRTYSRYKYDSNHNLCAAGKSSDEEADVKSGGSGSPSSSTSSRHSRFGSSDDLSSCSYGRRRRTSGQTFTSGYSSDASSTSSNGSPANYNYRNEKHETGGIVGLRNLGNTCFMNSVLQCLSNTRPLLEYCLRNGYLSDINITISSMKGALIKAFANLLQTMWKSNSIDSAINPQAFKSQIQKFAPRFMGYSQQDAQEFLRYLLQGMHEDVNRVTSKPSPLHSDIDDNLSDSQKATESWRRYLRFDDSKIVELFVGQLKSTLRCTTCGHTSVTFDPFWDLSLPIPKSSGSVKLSHCFDLFTREEVLDGDEKPTCSKCKTRRKCTKSFTIQKFPKILVIHLKRFSPGEKYRAKLTASVDFPLYNLDLSGNATNNSRNGQNCVYNLYGVSNHSGTVYTGHYTAYCKHPYTGDWYDFNDSRVSKVPSSSVTSSEAYVLFYEQVTHNSRL